MNVLKNLKVGALLLMALLPMAVGCGDAHRNDQGVSFLNTGWYDSERKGVGYAQTCQTAVNGANYHGTSEDDDNKRYYSTLVLWMGLQNNLASEYIRVQRFHHTYHVYGAEIQPPDTSTATNGILLPSNAPQDPSQGMGPWDTTTGQPGESTLPDNLANGSNDNQDNKPAQFLYLPTPVITTDVASFMSLNRTQMPEPPFTMVVESYAEGVTSAGRRIYSNTGYIEVLVQADGECDGTDVGQAQTKPTPTPSANKD